MSSNRSGRLGRRAAEQLLDGAPGDGRTGDPLASVLAAAAAPPRTAEQAGEDAAVAAFRAEHLVPDREPERGQMIKSPLAKILTMKVGAVALAMSAGGVALAASTGAFTPGSPHAHSQLAASASATGGSSQVRNVTGPAKQPSHPGSGSHGSTPSNRLVKHPSSTPGSTGTLTAAGVVAACRTLAGDVYATVNHTSSTGGQVLTETGLAAMLDNPALRQVADNPQLASLVATAEGETNVADYCGLVLHVARLASPATLGTLPASVLAGIPTSEVLQVPGSALASVPAASLAKLPVAFVSRLSSQALTPLPAEVLAKLPTGTLAGVLPRLPVATVAALPTRVLVPVLSSLPTQTAVSVLVKLPVATLTQLVPSLPKSLVSALPASLLGQLGI